MLGIPANLIQQAENLTQRHNDDQVLRLRNGKIVVGEFKGTGLQKFKGMLVKLFWPPTSWKKEFLEARQASFEDVSKQEEQAFARALAGAISKRTTKPYTANSSKVVDIRQLLNESQTDRLRFDRIVANITDALTHPSEMITDPLDGAKQAADLAVENEQLCRVAQMQQLRSDVTEILSRAGVKKATIKQLDAALDDKTVKVALYNVACDYARRVYSPPQEWSESSPDSSHGEQHKAEPRTPSEEQEQAWKNKREMSDADRNNSFKFQSPTDLAVDQMLEQGDYIINPDDIPEGKHVAKKIKQLRKIKETWSEEAIKLLENGSPENIKKAILLEKANLHTKEHAKLQKAKAKAVHQTQTAYWSRTRLKAVKKVERLEDQGIKDNSHFPQKYRDLAAKRISRPLYYDNVQLPMEEAIDQTINMLKSAYPSLADKGNAFREEELRERLQRFLTNRQVEHVEVPTTMSSSTQTDEFEVPFTESQFPTYSATTQSKDDAEDNLSVPGESVYGESVYGESVYGKSVYGKSVSGESGIGMGTDNEFLTPPTSLTANNDKSSKQSNYSPWNMDPPPLDDKE
ncbi:hypothetical protein GZ77_22500 [Endozoicomonas montiporae]|uniref:Uncharacterized protein n=2 Tax=Endozoicomonas montiporae TaxID=1027273 RepID=A0A081N0C1_9GAMM|nr:hypothetical protein [Endozoicomonas montiporae]AMO54347.1 hypothetical protein EZMO1_0074 [Endozoicomonas montiporae CL-33]KEQ11894.1 hypothetical protein GZ77_22500 [Endozoicomonas montiporae]